MKTWLVNETSLLLNEKVDLFMKNKLSVSRLCFTHIENNIRETIFEKSFVFHISPTIVQIIVITWTLSQLQPRNRDPTLEHFWCPHQNDNYPCWQEHNDHFMMTLSLSKTSTNKPAYATWQATKRMIDKTDQMKKKIKMKSKRQI